MPKEKNTNANSAVPSISMSAEEVSEGRSHCEMNGCCDKDHNQPNVSMEQKIQQAMDKMSILKAAKTPEMAMLKKFDFWSTQPVPKLSKFDLHHQHFPLLTSLPLTR